MCVRSIDVTYHYLISVLIFKCHVPVEKSLLHRKIEIPRKNSDKRNKLYIKAPLRGQTYAATSSFDRPLKFCSR